MFASTVDFRLSLDFFDSGLYTCTAVARLTLALAKLSCYNIVKTRVSALHRRYGYIFIYILVMGPERQAHNVTE